MYQLVVRLLRHSLYRMTFNVSLQLVALNFVMGLCSERHTLMRWTNVTRRRRTRHTLPAACARVCACV